MLGKGLPGMVRLAKNGMRLAIGRWEQPATAEWWHAALAAEGFVELDVTPLDHEGGVARARRPLGY